MSFQIETMFAAFKVAFPYIGVTLFIATSALLIGMVFGLGIALLRTFKVKFLSQIFQVIITVMKGVPIVLIILGIFLVASKQLDVIAQNMGWAIRFKDISPISIAIFALSIMATINFSESFRGALASINPIQYDAAKSIGMSAPQMIRRVLLPQAFPVALPMITSLYIALVKASALASMVSVVDVFAAAKIAAQRNYRFLESYVAIAIIYWMISLTIEMVSNVLEKRMGQKMRRSLV